MTTPEVSAGVFLVDKPVGPTSFAMVRQLRKQLGIKKVGHAGTLDPFASGLLILCAGRAATRMISRFMGGDKEYLATVCLGRTTTTLDPEGEVVCERPVGTLDGATVQRCLSAFRGEIMQRPPIYSAVKHQGKPLYHYARQGIVIEKEPRQVQIHTLERIDGEGGLQGDFPLMQLRVVCSKGTYVRTLAADIGAALGCGGYLTALRRVRSGPFSITEALDGLLLSQAEAREEILARMLSIEQAANMLQSPSELANIPDSDVLVQ